jgi:hypothetical protein
MNFNTVNEVASWKSFTFEGTIYDLSHLDARWIEYLDSRDAKHPITYRFVVTYSFHCFAKDLEDSSEEQSQLLMYRAPRDSRPFNFERYELSKYLPKIISSLGEKETLVCHAGYGSFAAVKVLDSNGNEIDYFVSFVVFKEKKKLRLHVQSAYPLDRKLGNIKKVSFFAIAKNLLLGKKLPKP